MKYTVYYTLRGTEGNFKADLYSEENRPPESYPPIVFEADDDLAAISHLEDVILSNDERPLCKKNIISKCREKKPKGSKGSGVFAPLIDLNFIKEPMKTKLFEALSPLIESGELIDDSFKLRPKEKVVNKPKSEKKATKKKKETKVSQETIPGQEVILPVQEPVAQQEPAVSQEQVNEPIAAAG